MDKDIEKYMGKYIEKFINDLHVHTMSERSILRGSVSGFPNTCIMYDTRLTLSLFILKHLETSSPP
jgi:hypothetical protein